MTNLVVALMAPGGFVLGWCIFTGRIPHRERPDDQFVNDVLPKLVGGIFMVGALTMMAMALHHLL
ncbi:hypothetical protein [Streptomyces sp. NPDC058279]|uniref:hypothetical protein n=1 Tax=Streptomyces sp. NPDC058279 TaxID=3346418 RepID=UPI0036EAB652